MEGEVLKLGSSENSGRWGYRETCWATTPYSDAPADVRVMSPTLGQPVIALLFLTSLAFLPA